MEDLGGIEVLKTLRQLDPAARVIVISADVQKSTEKSAIDAGAARFMGKPANEQALLAAVDELVS
ncbi:MAG TPA: response regulator, partial [Gemmatimonadaceae bacterium]|nr:response regulator [Gemmatimonadaceae bacterium]